MPIPILPILSLLVSAYGASQMGKGGNVSQGPMLTPEQQEAMQELMRLYKVGLPEYGGKLGEFEMTGLEATGQEQLKGLLAGGLPRATRMGSEELERVLTTREYDPYADKYYGALKTGIMRESEESQAALNREAARTGALSSTWRGEETGKLAGVTQGKLATILGELSERERGRKLQAAGMATQAGAAEEQMRMGRIEAASTIGSLGRLLKDAEAKAKYGEWIRKEGTKLNLLTSVLGKGIDYGVKDFPIHEQNPWLETLDKAMEKLGEFFSKKGNNVPANYNDYWYGEDFEGWG